MLGEPKLGDKKVAQFTTVHPKLTKCCVWFDCTSARLIDFSDIITLDRKEPRPAIGEKKPDEKRWNVFTGKELNNDLEDVCMCIRIQILHFKNSQKTKKMWEIFLHHMFCERIFEIKPLSKDMWVLALIDNALVVGHRFVGMPVKAEICIQFTFVW